MNNTFGNFIKDKIDNYLKENKDTKKSDLIRTFEITTQYLNDIENGKRIPSAKLMKKMIKTLNFEYKDEVKLFDLASENKKGKKIPADIEEYILNNKDAKDRIRKLMKEVEGK